MANNPAFLMYYKEWLVSTAGWDADERGWFINLLCHQADKPNGLPIDLESLAELAGVKISQFNRFNECWKRTLEARFKANDKGLLQNKKLEKVNSDRKEYTEKQAERGLIGYYVKLARKKNNINDEQAKRLYKELSTLSLNEKTHTERDECFKHTLKAIYANVNANANINKEIGGVGEGELESDDLLAKILFSIHGVKNISELDEKEKLYPMLVLEMMKIFIEQNPDYFVEIETDYHACLKIAYKIADLQKWNHSVVLNGKMPECLMRWSEIVRFQRQDEYFSQLTLEGIEKNFQKIVKKNSTHGKYSKSSGHRGLASKNTGSEIETPL